MGRESSKIGGIGRSTLHRIGVSFAFVSKRQRHREWRSRGESLLYDWHLKLAFPLSFQVQIKWVCEIIYDYHSQYAFEQHLLVALFGAKPQSRHVQLATVRFLLLRLSRTLFFYIFIIYVIYHENIPISLTGDHPYVQGTYFNMLLLNHFAKKLLTAGDSKFYYITYFILQHVRKWIPTTLNFLFF